MGLPSLTGKQKAWAQAYVGPARFNASEAARLTGIAISSGVENRSKPHIMDYVEELQKDALRRHMISQARTLEELVAIGFSNITDILTVDGDGRVTMKDLDEAPRHVTSSIKKMKLKRTNKPDGDFDEILEIELHDKMTALKMLGTFQGLFERQDGGDDEEKPVFTGLEIVAPKEES